MLLDGRAVKLNAEVVPYDLNSALFTDYAFKLRAAYLPAGKQVGYKADGTLDFPIGSARFKTFYYPKATGTDAAYTGVAQRHQDEQGSRIDLDPHVLIETRVMVRQADGT
jgi:sirohydrochlorin ferrochelatase